MSEPIFSKDWKDLLLKLLETDTQSPLETGRPSQIDQAQEIVAGQASKHGFDVVHFEPPSESDLEAEHVPLVVKDAVAQMGEAFIRSQPNLVLRAGTEQPPERTIVVNFHIDTVAGWWQPSAQADRF